RCFPPAHPGPDRSPGRPNAADGAGPAAAKASAISEKPGEDNNSELKAELTLPDFTLLVVGAIIGADVYIVAALGAGFLGPAQLVAWAVAGILAALVALAFIQCAAIDPDVGGSYSYARTAFGPF